jgi:hypothetical protein
VKAFAERLRSRHPIGLHLTVILFLMTVFGMVFGRTLLALGMNSLVLRDSIVIAASYCFFFFLVRLWLGIIASDPRNLEIPDEDLKGASSSEDESCDRNSKWGWLNFFPGDIGEGTLFLILFLAAILIIAWVAFEGPVILTESVFEVALSAGLAQAANRRGEGEWYEGLLRRTFLAFFIFWTVSFISLMVINNSCPGKVRLSQVVKECWKHQ